jgi:hypothetical protein
MRVFILPAKANPIPIIDPDAVLTGPVAFEGFQVVAGWHPQVSQFA